MTRISLLLVVVFSAAACNTPSDSACRKAIQNMRSLLGTDSPTNQSDIEGDVRRCKGGSRKKAVECAGNAKPLDELRACDFMKVPPKAGDTTGSNAMGSSAAGSSAAGSSNDMGSAANGSATGSASAGSGDMGSTSGSAAGSAAAGSAASGSAAGSAASGSSAGSAAGSAK